MPVRSRVIPALIAVLALLPFGTVNAQRNERPARHASRGLHIAIAGGSDYATEAGMRMYDRGGNAIEVWCFQSCGPVAVQHVVAD